MSRQTTTLAAVAVMLVAGLVAVPTVSAQGQTTFDFSFSGLPNGPVEALQIQNFKIDYSYSYQVAAQSVAGAAGTTTAEFRFNCPPTVAVTGDTTKIIVVTPGNNNEVTGTANLQMVISRDAKALDSLQCSVQSSVGAVQAQGLQAPDPVTRQFVVQADYFGLLEAKTDLKLKEGGPQKQIPFNLEVTNFGNGQTKVSFQTTESPGGKWQGLAPDQVLLDEKDGNRPSTSAVYTVVTPFKNGWNNEEGAFTLKITSEYAFNPDKKGSDVIVNLVARVRGVYVPSLEPMIMVGAVIGSAMVARLMRKEE